MIIDRLIWSALLIAAISWGSGVPRTLKQLNREKIDREIRSALTRAAEAKAVPKLRAQKGNEEKVCSIPLLEFQVSRNRSIDPGINKFRRPPDPNKFNLSDKKIPNPAPRCQGWNDK